MTMTMTTQRRRAAALMLLLSVVVALLAVFAVAPTAHAGSSQTCSMNGDTVRCNTNAMLANGGRRVAAASATTLAAVQSGARALFLRRLGRRLKRLGRRIGRGIRRLGRGIGRVARRVGRGIGRVARRLGRFIGRLFKKKKRNVCLGADRKPVLCASLPINGRCQYRCHDAYLEKNVCECPSKDPLISVAFEQVSRPQNAANSCPQPVELGVIPLVDARQLVNGIMNLCRTQHQCQCDEKGIGLAKLSAKVSKDIQKSGLQWEYVQLPGAGGRKRLTTPRR